MEESGGRQSIKANDVKQAPQKGLQQRRNRFPRVHTGEGRGAGPRPQFGVFARLC